jgi:hypothetical protein
MKANEFRIFGPEVNQKESYLDVVVDGIGDDGSIYFAEVNGERDWQLSSERVSELIGDNLLLESSEISQHKLWQRLDKLTKDRLEGRLSDNFAIGSVEDAQRSLFNAVFEETH